MRVLTRNVFWRWGGDWRERATAVLATLRAHEPDVVIAPLTGSLVDTWRAAGGDPGR